MINFGRNFEDEAYDLDEFQKDSSSIYGSRLTKKDQRSIDDYDRISWEEYFMSLALLSAQRSKDPVTKVGACIVDMQNKVVSIGYNGMPRGCNDKDLSWNKNRGLDNKNLYVCHAELNAVLNATDNRRLVGSTVYVTLFPCNECAKVLIQAGVSEIVYLSNEKADHEATKASRTLLDAAGIGYRPYKGRYNKVILN